MFTQSVAILYFHPPNIKTLQKSVAIEIVYVLWTFGVEISRFYYPIDTPGGEIQGKCPGEKSGWNVYGDLSGSPVDQLAHALSLLLCLTVSVYICPNVCLSCLPYIHLHDCPMVCRTAEEITTIFSRDESIGLMYALIAPKYWPEKEGTISPQTTSIFQKIFDRQTVMVS